jgi:signal transduction histidine kinase
LRPAGLDELGLPAAIEHYLHSLRGRLPELQVDLAIAGDFDDLAEAVNITLYRVIQEGLTNNVRHANATSVEICLNRTAGAIPQRRSEITLTITDNGRGPSSGGSGGLGLIGMRERVESLGGRLEVRSGALCGFLVSAWLPVIVESV